MSDYNGRENLWKKAAGRLSNVVLLGFFATLFSLPIVTAGASFTALNVAMESCLSEENDRPLKLFVASFKRYFLKATGIWLLHLLLFAILLWDLIYYGIGKSTLEILAAAGIFVLLVFLLFESVIVFVIIPEEEDTRILPLMKKALDIALYSPVQSLMIIMLLMTVILAALFVFRMLLLVIPGVVAFLSWQILPDMLRKYKYRKKKEDH